MTHGTIRADVILADAVDTVDDKLTIVGAGWNRLLVSDPSGELDMAFGVAILLRFSPASMDEPHELRVRLLDDAGEPVTMTVGDEAVEVLEVGATVSVPRPPGELLLHEETMPVAFNARARLPAIGRYRFVVAVDGIDCRITAFAAVPAAAPPLSS